MTSGSRTNNNGVAKAGNIHLRKAPSKSKRKIYNQIIFLSVLYGPSETNLLKLKFIIQKSVYGVRQFFFVFVIHYSY